VKVNFAPEEVTKDQMRSGGIVPLFLILGVRWGGRSASRPDRYTPGKETRYPLHKRLSEPRGRSGRVRRTSPSPGRNPVPSSP